MSRISPRVDIAFKKIFGVEENKDLLISLINSIVSDQDQVSDITLLNPYNAQNFTRDKLSILDIKAKGFDGKLFNIEIQISDEADYDKRALYYWAKLYTEQLEVAEDYSTLSKAIGIHILNFISIPEVDKYHNIFHITEKETGQSYFKDLELHTIELKKFSKDSSEQLPDIISKVKNSLDMWLAFLTRHDLLQSDKLSDNLDNSDLKKALTVLDVMNFSSLERDAYEDHLKWLRIEANTLKKAEAKGVEKGREEGREEGIAIGEARSEIKSIEKIAKRMLKKNTDITFISSVTGISNDQLLKLKNKL
jgi:predicted transposase/invertase (TIGR01784 family)